MFLYYFVFYIYYEGLVMEKRLGRWKELIKRLYLESRGFFISVVEIRLIRSIVYRFIIDSYI